MSTQILGKQELLKDIEDAAGIMREIFVALDEKTANKIPFPGSWTAAQVIRHISKSANGIARAISETATKAERDPGARIEELRSIFLNFSMKVRAPEFIEPEEGFLEKQMVLDKFDRAFDRFRQAAINADPDKINKVGGLGEITNLESVHFILYHTQRHLNQLENIKSKL